VVIKIPDEMKSGGTNGVKIGLECHAQLLTKSKLFCPCSTDYHNSEPNTHVCATCLGLPGALPVVNERAIRYGIKVALALGCEVQEEIIFYRKNYYYPDLPRGFQITQYDFPIALNGLVRIESASGGNGGKEREIRIRRVHMEEDPGRLVYKGTIDTAKYSLVDYNRSGIPLVEIVTEPDLRSPKEARIFLGKLRSILGYLSVFDGDLEGAMRVDANISVGGGERAEVKNISSYKGVERALSFEITRQKNLVRRGLEVKQETRHYDEVRGITLSMRTKEFEHDYRYFPEPDLVPIRISDLVGEIRREIPELPDEKKSRFITQYSITREHANSLTFDINIANFYEQVASKIDAGLSATWIADVLKGELNYRAISMREASKRFSADDFVSILRYLKKGVITERGATEIIREMLDRGGEPDEIIKRKGLASIGSEEMERAVLEVIKENEGAVEDYKAGKKEALNFLVGQVMKKTRGRATPQVVHRMIRGKNSGS
jgi:aspartyl-tRNA(Asn)/glutamyl-tRNA(Gln) amidotransferase subunit B